MMKKQMIIACLLAAGTVWAVESAEKIDSPVQGKSMGLKKKIGAGIGAGKEKLITSAKDPAVVLPPVLLLLEDELTSYGIDRVKLAEEIESNPDSFRKGVPEHVRERFLILTPEHEKQIGDKLDAELAASGKVYNDPKAMAEIQPVAESLAKQMPEKTPLKLFLYRDDSINAFCLPNGSVYVHSGLLEKIKDRNMRAFILAHELAHIAAKHGNEKVTKQMFFMAGDNAATIISSIEKEKIKRGLIRLGYRGGAHIAALLPLERKSEYEADTLAIRYMARAGYNPEGAVAFWESIGNLEEGNLLKELLSTHPLDKKRHARLLEECKKLKNGQNETSQQDNTQKKTILKNKFLKKTMKKQ